MLTDTKLRSLKPKEKIYRLADSNGLCIEVTPGGSLIWRYRYRYAGKANMMSFGQYPIVGLSKARQLRDNARKLLSDGTDPSQHAKHCKASQDINSANTFAAIGYELIAMREREGIGAGSIQRERRLIERDLANLAEIPIAEITPPILLSSLRKIEDRRVIETAHRARAFASRVFRYAISTGRAERDPAADLIGALERASPTHFAAVTEPEKLAKILRAMWVYKGTSIVQLALRLTVYLFVRPGELRSMQWDAVNFETGEWRYYITKTKTEHIVPLASQVLDLLRSLHPLTKRSKFVFHGARSIERPMSENAINVALHAMGIDGSTTVAHGFRATARTILDEVLGYRPEIIEHQLAHRVKDANGRAYNRTAHIEQRRKMMQEWADYVDRIILIE